MQTAVAFQLGKFFTQLEADIFHTLRDVRVFKEFGTPMPSAALQVHP